MGILKEALVMLEKYPLCDHCLGRQFALLGHGLENDERGKSIKLVLALKAHAACLSRDKEGLRVLKILALNGSLEAAKEVLQKLKHSPSRSPDTRCFLCEDRFYNIKPIVEKALALIREYEYQNFLVGIELPLTVEEREDEFRSNFNVCHGESMRNEFGRLFGKGIAEGNQKPVEFMKPEIVVLINPFTEEVKLQVNPLFVAGKYRKLVRGLPQSKWFCTSCHGKGCQKCGWTGKLYAESVEEIIGKPFLEATEGTQSSFHASGREDIDARMLGTGRPFVIEIARPRKRLLDLRKMRKAVNDFGKGKIQISDMRFADKGVVRNLKKGESTQKEYRVQIEFEHKVSLEDIRTLKNKLTRIMIAQKTPNRVLHRRADLTREKYIYEVNVKKLSPKKAEMRIRCQGGLYVKELVTGDEGRTVPSVSQILENKAKPVKLDVLGVIMQD